MNAIVNASHRLVAAAPVMMPITKIKPSPENDELYGAVDPDSNDLILLTNSIIRDGLLEPIIVSRDGWIVSGHRRHAASLLAGLTEVPVCLVPRLRRKMAPAGWKKILRSFNHQRVKSSAVRMKEAALDIDPDIAHKQLIDQREELDRDALPQIEITGSMVRSGVSERKQEFLNASLRVIEGLRPFWPVTVRQVHYGLLNNPPLRNTSKGSQRAQYQNDTKSYNDLCDLLTRARLIGAIPWDAITDETRPTSGTRFTRDAAEFVDTEFHHFLRHYRRDLLQSQADHVELIVEKLTVQGIVQPVAAKYCVPMTVGRGYCSLQPRYQIVQRYKRSGKDRLKLLIVSDFDPDGDEIADSFFRSIRDDFGVAGVTASKVLLRQDQVAELGIPSNGLEAKESSSKFKKFVERYGSTDVYELEAVPPLVIRQTIADAIEATIDLNAFNRELADERQDAVRLQAIKEQFKDAFPGMLGNELESDG